jgi:hypothetical protein
MGQPAPKEYAVPRATIRATSEAQIEFIEALDDAECCTLECKQIEDRTDCALDLLIWIEDDLVVLENKSDRQGEAQFALGGLVELTAMEARADDVQLR